MYTGIDLRTIKFLDPSLLQHKLKELFQTGVYEANMYLMLCAINHSQHIHLSKTEPQLSLSLSLSQLYTPPAPPPHQRRHDLDLTTTTTPD